MSHSYNAINEPNVVGSMLYACFLFCFMLGMLSNGKLSNSYAMQGLQSWFHSAIPALFPFMILSGILIRMNLAEKFASIFHPILGKLFHVSKAGSYVVFMGFLCGFPMGAKTIGEMYERKSVSQEESRWLLSFCNNIGPAYFCGIFLPLFKLRHALPILVTFYGVPLIWGILTRRRYSLLFDTTGKMESRPESLPLSKAISSSIQSALNAILMLGGYVILFCMLNLIPHLIAGEPVPLLSPLFEITTGLTALDGSHPIYCLAALAFGGASCMAQTYEVLPEGLRPYFKEYLISKVLQTLIIYCLFVFLFYLFPTYFY